MSDDRVLSILLNAEMDSVGFNKVSVKHRVEMFKKRSDAKSAASRQILGSDHKEKIIVGSRRDGIAMETSDTDVLLINHGVHCSSDAEELEKEDNKVCLLLESEDAPPGYAYLSVHKYRDSNGKHFKELEPATEFRNGKMYMSSEKYMDIIEEQEMASRRGWFGRVVKIGTRKGPSIPKSIDALGFEADLVGAFTASYKPIIRKWQDKKRANDWPSAKTVEAVAKLPLYVVAVGEHGCPDENFLWRISYNKPEMVLVHSMNDSQTKVLVMMRILAKTLLTPVCPDITSYVIKNVVFHVSEQHPLQEFSKEKLFHRLQDCLKFLRCCIENKFLPNYMNAERNLFQGKLTSETLIADATHVIDDIIENGREVFLFYLTNKTRPGNIRSKYPRLLPVRASLIKGYLEDRFAQKKVNAMTPDQLVNLHVQADNCTSEVKLFFLELYYVYIPFYFKYGLRSLKSDLSKIRSQNQKMHLQDKPITGEDFDDTDETVMLDKEEVDDEEIEDIDQEEVKAPVHSELVDEEATESNTTAREIWTYVTALLYFLIFRSIAVIKFTLFNLFEILHLLCVILTWVSVRDSVGDETVWLVDITGLAWVGFIGVSVIQKRIAPMFNLIYMILLMCFWRMMMSHSGQYTLYLQELYVMLDPRQYGRRNFHTADLDMDDPDLFNSERIMYV